MGLLAPGEHGLQRGVQLFTFLVDAANHGDALGISYGDFIAYLHGARNFSDLTGRSYMPGDTGEILTAAHDITAKAGGRKRVARREHVIDAGMDTFIWSSKRPFDRPEAAWNGSRVQIPYSRAEWLAVFPGELRRLAAIAELEHKLGPRTGPASGVPEGLSLPAQQINRELESGPTTRKASLSASQISDLRRRLVQFIARLDPTGNRPVKDSVGAHISRLSFAGVIPREIGAAMRTVTEMRNATEYESKTLTPAQSALVEAAWAAIEEWAASRRLEI